MEGLEEQNSKFVDYLVERHVIKSKRIEDAFRKIPRYLFVRKEYLEEAHVDLPLPVGHSATISQPSAVASMLEGLGLVEGDNVLEIGAGSGWNAALMGYIVGETGSVISLELDHEIADSAKANVKRTKARNVTVICMDGSAGYPEEGPYDRIIYTVAIRGIPDNVIGQLKVGGSLLAPVGGGFVQELVKVDKTSSKDTRRSVLGYYQFVHLR